MSAVSLSGAREETRDVSRQPIRSQRGNERCQPSAYQELERKREKDVVNVVEIMQKESQTELL